ncbi:hypothetical protein CTEN210_14116 [Chaetoceros tenuissimus]|uniref:Uncharacterized protein n=1 Tax=Chaetoceros tenuissimus TaxID=426638 RepID=A0AAD3D6W3_9STRA|nr:hypothetical protein CTEN210_14116 [Chaetoceros tenuissimus]
MASHRFSGKKSLPKGICLEHEPFLHPDEKLTHYNIQENDKVIVELYDKICLDELSCPVYSNWTTIAFFTSSKKDLRGKLIEEQIEKAKLYKIEQQKLDEEKTLLENKPRIAKMKQLLSNQFLDHTQMNTCLSKEWNELDHHVLERLVPAKDEIEAVKQVFLKSYFELAATFKYFSALNSQGGVHRLEFLEFQKLVHDTGLLKDLSGTSSGVILKIFGSDLSKELCRSEFLLCIVRLALFKKSRSKKNKQLGRENTISLSSTIEGIVENYFRTHLESLSLSKTIKEALNEDSCLLCLHKYLTPMERTFSRFSENSESMTLKQFTAFGTLFQSEENGLTQKQIRQVFSSSQSDIASSEEDTNNEHDELMVFPEFVEGLVRLAVLIYPTETRHSSKVLDSLEKTLQEFIV